MCFIVVEDKLEELDFEFFGYMVGWLVVGCYLVIMGIGFVFVVEKFFVWMGFGWDDIDLVEFNEVFVC